MKKIFSIGLVLTFGLMTMQSTAQRYGDVKKVAVSNPCSDFHRKSCAESEDETFVYNGQSKSGLFSKGQTSTVKVIFYKGMDYHIAVCSEEEAPLVFTVKDIKTGEVLYDNATDNNTQEIQISNVNTRQVSIQVTVPGEAKKEDKVKGELGVCAGVLVHHRRSDKTGF